MPGTRTTARGLLRAAHGGWWFVALVILWAQFVAAAHHHAAPGEVPVERVAACDLCIAHGTPAAPPPGVPELLVPAHAAAPAPLAGRGLPPLRPRQVPHSPRAPPWSRHA